MEFHFQYHSDSQITHRQGHTELCFAPDHLRPPTYFSGHLSRHLPFREAISALHEVVESDLRFQPRDKSDYRAWLKAQEEVFLAEALSKQGQIQARLSELRAELRQVQEQEQQILEPYYRSQSQYFRYLYATDYDAWFVLDPVISVHPDQIFFECFSQDESAYGKLACDLEIFSQVQEMACGTTNIDYSHRLYQEFQRIRDYKDTEFKLDPSGFEVQTGTTDTYREAKIDLPDSWVRGFLQVSSAMTLPMTRLKLHPMDLYNLLLYLRRHREQHGPRSLRFVLEPGQPITIRIEPWNHDLRCPRSLYTGSESREIRIWGRRRLFVLERLLPVCQSIDLYLLGSGLPSFWIAQLPGMRFTLGLSGWTANDFSRLGQFDLLAPRAEVDADSAAQIFAALQKDWVASAETLARKLNRDPVQIRSALSIYAQSGRVLYELESDRYRLRELSREPLPLEQLRFANPREARARFFVQAGLVNPLSTESQTDHVRLSGEILDNAIAYRPEIVIDSDQRLIAGQCFCHFYLQNHLRQGPCEHMLALRLNAYEPAVLAS